MCYISWISRSLNTCLLSLTWKKFLDHILFHPELCRCFYIIFHKILLKGNSRSAWIFLIYRLVVSFPWISLEFLSYYISANLPVYTDNFVLFFPKTEVILLIHSFKYSCFGKVEAHFLLCPCRRIIPITFLNTLFVLFLWT